MVDRRLVFWIAVLLAFGVLALLGWTPPVLWARAQAFVANATGARRTQPASKANAAKNATKMSVR